jgi:hypothetical protein
MMNVNNPPKFLLLLVALVGIFTLMAIGRISPDAPIPWATIGTIVGYGVGNGIASKRGDPVEPVFGRKPEPKGDDVP